MSRVLREHEPSQKLRDKLTYRAEWIKSIRLFFECRQVVEVDTPVMGEGASTDPHIHSFSVASPVGETNLRTHCGYLQTSPEFFMKRLLAAGSGDIYQIAKAFRAGERGRLHSPEFTLLEWYRLGFDHHQLMEEVALLVQVLLGSCAERWRKVSYKTLFNEHFNLNPHTSSVADLLACADAKGIDKTPMLGLNESGCLDFLFSFFIQPHLNTLTFVYDYPSCQSMLSRLGPSADVGDPPVAYRFELFMEGVELANGFNELTDANEQRQRFEQDLSERRRLGRPSVPMDQAFLKCLEGDFPACAGVSIGIDRLLMLAWGARDIFSFTL